MGPRDEYHKFLYKVNIYPSFILLCCIYISWIGLICYKIGPRICDIHLLVISKIPQKSFFPFIYEYNISMSIGFYWCMCFTRQSYSLTLKSYKMFHSFCYYYYLIFKYDLSNLLTPIKICFFEKIVIAYGEILGPICAWAWYQYNEDSKPYLCCFCLSLKRWHSKKF